MGSFVRAAALVAAGSWCVAVAAVARGTDGIEFGFDTGPSGWTSPEGEWAWSAEGSGEKSWKWLLTGGNPAANTLLSPAFRITDTRIRFDILEHRFAFGTSSGGKGAVFMPPAGQVQYALDGDVKWRGIPLEAWQPLIGSGDGVAPTLDPSALEPKTSTALLMDGYAFEGASDREGDKERSFITSGFELSDLPVEGPIRFRLVGDLGGGKAAEPSDRLAWDVNRIRVSGVAVDEASIPEPDGLVHAVTALVVSTAAWCRRSRATRRRSRRPCSVRPQSPARGASG